MNTTRFFSSPASQIRRYPELNRIPDFGKRAEKLILQRLQRSPDFPVLQTPHLSDNVANYPSQIDRYTLNCAPATAWQAYTEIRPDEMWQGDLVRFLYAYSKPNDAFYYKDQEDMPKVHAGLQIFCMLWFGRAFGVVGIEILEINAAKQLVSLAYLEGGIFKGLQHLRFYPHPNDQTEIVHESWRKPLEGKEWARFLPYVFMHRKTIGEYHQAMKNRIKNQ
ncbi:MAG: hypothetical protein AAFY71_00925 [Bacteroidota bacterium]